MIEFFQPICCCYVYFVCLSWNIEFYLVIFYVLTSWKRWQSYLLELWKAIGKETYSVSVLYNLYIFDELYLCINLLSDNHLENYQKLFYFPQKRQKILYPEFFQLFQSEIFNNVFKIKNHANFNFWNCIHKPIFLSYPRVHLQ